MGHGNINLATANPVTNRPCDLIRPRWVPASDYDTTWVVGGEFGRNAPPNHAVATDD